MGEPASVAITGATGLVGRALSEAFRLDGLAVTRLVRRPVEPGSSDLFWKPDDGVIDAQHLEGIEACVHLAGESVAQRWTPETRRRIVDSRVQGTRVLCQALAGLERKPSVLVSASAVGFYGDRGAEPVDERSLPGEGFLAETCVRWEAETRPAWEAGIRVVQLRIGLVLSRQGGLLATVLPLFKLGLGGKLGGGAQYMSWITLHDLVRAITFCVRNDAVHEAVNAVAPNPVTNAEFTKALGARLGRPTFLPAPAFALKTALGDMAEEMMLAGARVHPTRLAEAGFTFDHPTLDDALRVELDG